MNGEKKNRTHTQTHFTQQIVSHYPSLCHYKARAEGNWERRPHLSLSFLGWRFSFFSLSSALSHAISTNFKIMIKIIIILFWQYFLLLFLRTRNDHLLRVPKSIVVFFFLMVRFHSLFALLLYSDPFLSFKIFIYLVFIFLLFLSLFSL